MKHRRSVQAHLPGQNQHTSRVLQSEAPFMHLVLLHLAPPQPVYAPRRISLHLQLSRQKRPLLPNQNIEIIVGSVHARVSLRAQRRSEDNEILGYGGVNDVHGAHGPAGVVEHPFVLVCVEGDLRGGEGGREIGQDVRDHASGVVVRVGGDGFIGELVQKLRVEDKPSLLLVKITFRQFKHGMNMSRRTLIVSRYLKKATKRYRTPKRISHLRRV